MKKERIKSKRFQGVYYRESTERKHLGKPDKAFWITWTENGKKQWENVGNASGKITEEYAYQRRLEIISKLNAGETPDVRSRRKSITLEDIMQAYFDWKKAEGKRVDSDKSRHGKHVKPFFGNMPVQNITPEVLDKFKATLLACQSPASAKKLFTTLRAAINFAIKRNIYTGKNPISTQTSTFTLPRGDNKGERFLTREEAKKLLEDAVQPIRRYADARVRDLDDYSDFSRRVCRKGGTRDGNPAFMGEFHGVADHVEQYLADPRFVPHQVPRNAGINVERKHNPPFPPLLSRTCRESSGRRPAIEFFSPQRHLARPHAGVVEKIGDYTKQSLA